MSSLEEHNLALMMIEQENEAMMRSLVVICDQCLVFNEEKKKTGNTPDLLMRWTKHLETRHNL